MSSQLELRRLIETPPRDILEHPLDNFQGDINYQWSEFSDLACDICAKKDLNQLAALLDFAHLNAVRNDDSGEQSNMPVHLQHRIFENLPSSSAAEFLTYPETRLSQWRSSTVETVLATTRLLRTKLESSQHSGRACLWVSAWVPLYKQPILFPKNADVELPSLPEGPFWDLQRLCRTANPAKVQELLQAITNVRSQRNPTPLPVGLRVGRLWNTEPEVLEILCRDHAVWRIVAFQILSVLQSLNLPPNSPYLSRINETRKVWQAVLRDVWPSDDITACDAFYEELLSRDRDWVEAASKKRMPEPDIAEVVEPRINESHSLTAEVSGPIPNEKWDAIAKMRPKYFNPMGNPKLSRIWKTETGLDNVGEDADIETSDNLDAWSKLRLSPKFGEAHESKTRELVESLDGFDDEPDAEVFSDESEWEAESETESVPKTTPEIQEKAPSRKRRFNDTEKPAPHRMSDRHDKPPAKRFKGGNRNNKGDKPWGGEAERDGPGPRREGRRGEPRRDARRDREPRRDPKREHREQRDSRGPAKWDPPTREIPSGPAGRPRPTGRGGDVPPRSTRGGRSGLPRRPPRAQDGDGKRTARPAPRSY